MASLYKRATKEQRRMLDIVAGAVRQAAHHHGVELPANFDRSVAKRAVGTLSAQADSVCGADITPVSEGSE